MEEGCRGCKKSRRSYHSLKIGSGTGSSVSKLFKLTREAVINYKVGLVVKGEGRREKGGGKRSWVRIPLLIKLTINICQLKKKRVNKGG